MGPPVDLEFSIIPNKLEEEENLEEGMCKKPKLSGSIVHGIEVPANEENKGSGVPYWVADYVGQSAGQENLCSKEHASGSTCNDLARSRLNVICSATGWKDPQYDFEEQGPPNNKLFSCKVTVHVDTITDTLLVCFSEPKHEKKDAQEQAAQGALWYLKHFGHAS